MINVDINASVDISQNLNVTGISTFASDININEDLIVGGNLNVVGVSTFQSNVNLGDDDRLRIGDGIMTYTDFSINSDAQ